MLHLTASTSILLATNPVDFRKQIDGLIALCEQSLLEQPRSGKMFVFINRSRTMIRVLCYEYNGYWLATKRLSQGRFQWPKQDEIVCPVKAAELTKILKGLIATDLR